MRKKLNKLKEGLDKQMLQKTNKQMIWYIIVSYIIWVTGLLFILLKLDGNSIIVCLLGILYFIFVVVLEVYLGHYQFLASLRDDERKKSELFKNGILLNVVPLTFNVYKEIVYTLKAQECKQLCCFQDSSTNFNEYRNIIDKMLENNEITLIAKLIDNEICISVYYEGKNHYMEELKSSNFRWFKANFLVVK